jgi:solute:Na+ symporter, SSS family
MEFSLLFAFFVYFGVLFFIGIFNASKNNSSNEFILGNRSINYWVTAIAAHASDMSAWLFMSFPAAIYMHGLVSSWIAVGLILGMFSSWHFIAHKLRIATEAYNALTLSSFLEKRFNDTSGLIGITSSIITILFFTFYIAAGLTAMGHIFESVFDINYHYGMSIGLLISLVYIMIGGFIAIAWNHFFQGMFLLAMILVVPAYALYTLGSIAPIVQQATLRNLSLQLLPNASYANIIDMINGLTWGIGYLGMPHIVVNFMGINDPSHIKRAKYLGMAWLITSLLAALMVGFVGIGYFPSLHNSELVFVELVKQLFPPLCTGFILCAILAATMSTIDTQILVVSSSITEDLYKALYNSTASEKMLVWISRLSILSISAASFMLAVPNSSTVMGLVSYAWSGLASAFSPVVVAALYSTSVTRRGALAGIISGGVVSALWPLIDISVLPLIPGVIASTLALIVTTMYAKS